MDGSEKTRDHKQILVLETDKEEGTRKRRGRKTRIVFLVFRSTQVVNTNNSDSVSGCHTHLTPFDCYERQLTLLDLDYIGLSVTLNSLLFL